MLHSNVCILLPDQIIGDIESTSEISSSVSFHGMAGLLADSCSIFRAPAMTELIQGFARSQAIANSPTV